MHSACRKCQLFSRVIRALHQSSLQDFPALAASAAHGVGSEKPGSGSNSADSVRGRKWNASPLSNPWGRAAGEVLGPLLPKPKLARGDKAPQLGSVAWQRQRRKMAAAKQGVTVSCAEFSGREQ